MRKPKYFTNCTVIRTHRVDYGDWHWKTGFVKKVEEFLTESCNNTLFAPIERETGICDLCASGYESAGDRFSGSAERERAANSRL